MEQTSDPLPGNSAVQSPAAPGELIIQNGRLRDTRKALTAPITTVGRSEGCDLRLNAESVHAFHCVLAFSASGLTLRNLPADAETRVNGEAVTACPLRDGDLLSIGPFQFRVHLPAGQSLAGAAEHERDALRIQAAAVAAQQAALTEEELRLQQRQAALELQEQQLATHLEEKRRRLLTVRDEARDAHAALQQTRAAYEQRVAQMMKALDQARRELADGQRQVQSERQHVLELRQRLKRRFHRHWAGERRALRLREAELAKVRRDLETERERVQQEKAGVMRSRREFNGEAELTRRQLHADREQVRKEQAELSERLGALIRREAVLQQREGALADERRHWEQAHLQLREEAQGLENRIVNSRRKLLELEQQIRQQQRDPGTSTYKNKYPPVTVPVRPTALLTLGFAWRQREQQLEMVEAELRSRLAMLHHVAGELADQRLCLADQYERLVQARQGWQQECASVTAEWETLGRRMQEREDVLRAREQALAGTEGELQQRSAELARGQRQLESRSARLAASMTTWEGERDRLLASVHAREHFVEQCLAALSAVRERWGQRRKRQVCRARAQRDEYEKLRRETEALRQEWVRGSTLLAQEQRALAGRALVLEQYRQQWIARAANPRAAEKRLERLRRRWAALAVSTERKLAQERKFLDTLAARLEERARLLHADTDQLAAQQADLASRQADGEQQQLQDQAEREKSRKEVLCLRDQRQSYERQLDALREEVERLARALLDENDPVPLPAVQAA